MTDGRTNEGMTTPEHAFLSKRVRRRKGERKGGRWQGKARREGGKGREKGEEKREEEKKKKRKREALVVHSSIDIKRDKTITY